MRNIIARLLSIHPAKSCFSDRLLAAQGLRLCSRAIPVGDDHRLPTFSWELQETTGSSHDQEQSAYRIVVSTSPEKIDAAQGDVWDSGKVSSPEQLGVRFGGHPLRSYTRYFWKVMVWDRNGRAGRWSEISDWTTGNLDPTNWQAKWIAATPDGPMEPQTLENRYHFSDHLAPMPVFRKRFSVTKPVRRALLFVSGLGQYEVHLNGQNITQSVLNPGWTNYRKAVLYNTFDLTQALRHGDNMFGVLLGGGMYDVRGLKGRYTKFVGSFGQPKLILQMHILYTDGSQGLIVSDHTWETRPGFITYSSIYGGEDEDARLLPTDWDGVKRDDDGGGDKDWTHALEVLGPDGHRNPGKLLDASYIPAIVIADRLVPIHVAHLSPTREVYDLGKNGSGWPEITVTGHAGDVVRILPGELLNPDGTVTQVSGGADPQDPVLFTYTLAGRGVEQWNPRFSYYGFRYVQIDLIPAAGHAPPEVLDLRGDFTHADVSLDGQFVSDNHLLNSIHDLIDRAILSNLSSVITDCPTREKLGWLEQTHLAGRSIMYNYGVHRLYEKMSQDMAEAQLKNGFVPAIAPEYVAFVDSKGKSTDFRDSPEWGSAVVLSPWEAYQFYGDRRLLEQHYDSMLRYVGYLHARLTNGILAYGLGDWYDIGPEPPGKSQLTSSGVTATAIYYEDLEVLAKIASLTGHPGDQIRFQQEATSTKRAFNNRFLHRDSGVYDLGSQTAQAMPLALGLVPAEERDRTLKRLVDDIRTHGNHVTAGDIGFHYLVRALTDAGRSDVLMDMFSQTDSPSYGYQLRQGATTLTEAWDARRSSSQNHFMLGHGEEWFYRGLAGIDLDFSRVPSRRLLIRPSFVRGVTQCHGSLQSVLGEISSSWGIHGSKLDLKIDVPVGVGAVFVLPSTATNASLDGKRVSGAEIPIGSGHFHVQAMVQ